MALLILMRAVKHQTGRVIPRAVKAASPIRAKGDLIKNALADPEATQKMFSRLVGMGRQYKGYIKVSGGTGALIGSTFAGAHMLDVLDERKLSRKEMVAFPVAGAIGGGVLGVTAPAWILFAPVGYVLGYDNVATIFKVLLTGALLSDE